MINIKTIKINNLGPFKEAQYDFSSKSIAVFIGINKLPGMTNNGAGKSMLFDLLSWIIWGQTIRKIAKDDIIRAGEKQGWGSVTFEKDGNHYIIKRFRGTRNDLRFEKIDEGAKEQHSYFKGTGKTIAITQQNIINVLGIDFDIFTSIAYLGQGETSKFLSGTSSERVEIVTQLFRLNNWDRLRENAKIRSDENEDDIKVNTEKIAILKETINQIDAKKIARIKSSLHKDKKYLQIVIEKLKKKLEDADLIKKMLIKKEHLLTEIKTELYSCQEKLKLIDEEMAINLEKSRKSNKLRERIKYWKKFILELNEAQQSLDTVAEQLEEATEKIGYEKSHYQTLKKTIETNRKILDNLAERNTCPTCGSTITDESKHRLNSINNRLIGQSKEVLRRINNQEQFCENLKNTKLAYQEHVSQLREKVDKVNQMKRELADINLIRERMKALTKRKSIIEKDSLIRVNALNKLISQIDEEIEDHPDLVNINLEELKNQYNEESMRLADINRRIDKYKFMLLQYRSATLRSDMLMKQIKEKQEMMYIYQYIVSAIPVIKLWIIDEINYQLENAINQKLAAMNSTMTISLLTEVDKKSGGKINKYELLVKQEGQKPRRWESYSGGEKQRLSFAICQAFQSVTQNRFGESINILLLDEIIMWLDSAGTDEFLELIKNAAEEKNVCIITHNEEFLNRISTPDNQVKIIKEINNISRIAV